MPASKGTFGEDTFVVIEKWSNLGGDSRIAYGLADPMDDKVPDVSRLLVSPGAPRSAPPAAAGR